MTVKELIGYLEQCNPEYRIQTEYGTTIDSIIQIEDLTDGESYVEIT